MDEQPKEPRSNKEISSSETTRIDPDQVEQAIQETLRQSASVSADRLDQVSVSGDLLSPGTSTLFPQYRQIPEHPPDEWNIAVAPRWQVEFLGLDPLPLGFEIVADVVIGVNRGTPAGSDLDLNPFGGEIKGVSRRHALLRPTPNRLFIIDLESTNGTRINSLSVGPGIARALASGDLISLAKLSFTIRFVETPTHTTR